MGVTADRRRIHVGGLGLAAIGFLLSRFTVANTVSMSESLFAFALTSAVPMVLAFGLVVVGLVLTVSTVPAAAVRTIVSWCVLGTIAMGVAVFVSAVDTGTLGSMGGLLADSNTSMASNTVLGGAVGGTLIGVYAARADQRNRRITSQADRLHLLNRLLRDEVLNSVTVVLAHADFLDEQDRETEDHVPPIRRNADHVRDIIDDVGALTDERAPGDRVFEPVTVGPLLDRCLETLETTHGEASVELSGAVDAEVAADDQLSMLFDQLLSNAVEHAGVPDPRVVVDVSTTETTVEVTVTDEGPGLGESERALLESGDLSRYDHPSEGFGLWIVRILLDRYGGEASVSVDDGTAVTVTLPRADASTVGKRETIGVSLRTLAIAGGAGVVAGIVMGATLQAFTNVLPVIGSLYGTASASVGWITHLFHSVVFAITFATALSHPRLRGVRQRLGLTTILAVLFGTILWLVAAGVVMPVWLRLVGIPVPIPRLQVIPLLGHLLWGGVFGVIYGVVLSDDT